MRKTVARKLLKIELNNLRVRTYSYFAQSVNKTTHREILGPDGFPYQIELEVFWEDRRGGNIRVLGSIDDGKLRAQARLTDSFIISRDGTFLDQ